MPLPPCPDDEEYSLLVGELTRAKSQLHQLELLETYESTHLVATQRPLIDTLLPRSKAPDIPRKVALQNRLAATRAQLQILEERMASYNDRVEACHEPETEDAAPEEAAV